MHYARLGDYNLTEVSLRGYGLVDGELVPGFSDRLCRIQALRQRIIEIVDEGDRECAVEHPLFQVSVVTVLQPDEKRTLSFHELALHKINRGVLLRTAKQLVVGESGTYLSTLTCYKGISFELTCVADAQVEVVAQRSSGLTNRSPSPHPSSEGENAALPGLPWRRAHCDFSATTMRVSEK